MKPSQKNSTARPVLPSPVIPGNGGRTRMPTGYCDSIFLKPSDSWRSLNSRCSKRFTNSTQDPGKAWDLKPPMRSFASSLALMLKMDGTENLLEPLRK